MVRLGGYRNVVLLQLLAPVGLIWLNLMSCKRLYPSQLGLALFVCNFFFIFCFFLALNISALSHFTPWMALQTFAPRYPILSYDDDVTLHKTVFFTRKQKFQNESMEITHSTKPQQDDIPDIPETHKRRRHTRHTTMMTVLGRKHFRPHREELARFRYDSEHTHAQFSPKNRNNAPNLQIVLEIV